MFQLAISGISEAPYIASRWATKVVSLLDVGTSFPGVVLREPHHLILNFDDIEQPTADKLPPSLFHADQILSFGQQLGDTDRLLVHCHVGIARSTAAAIGLCIQSGMSIEQAFDHVERVRNVLWPNDMLIEHIDHKLALGGALVAHVRNWKHNEQQRMAAKPTLFAPRAAAGLREFLRTK